MRRERHSRPERRGGTRIAPARALTLAFCLVAVVSACSTSDTDDATDRSPRSTPTSASVTTSNRPVEPGEATTSTAVANTSTSTAPSSGSSEGDEVIARYIGFWNARLDANTGTPNPDAPALAEYAAGAQLAQVKTETQTNLTDGVALRRAEKRIGIQRVTIVELGADHAVVQECVVDDAVVIRRDSGEVINDAVTTQNVRGELDRIDGKWRVTKAVLVQQWDGVAGCAG